MGKKVFIIAEAGVNHNGSLNRALEMVDVAANAKANAIKFQTFKTEELVAKHAPKAEYQMRNDQVDESQFDMLKKLELNEEDHFKIIEHCNQRNIKFLSTPFDSKSLHFLINRLNLEVIKIPSGEITNGPFLLEVARAAKKIILSTGMSNLGEIEKALKVIAFGFLNKSGEIPSHSELQNILSKEEAILLLKRRVVILHATTEYPAPVTEINLSAMNTIFTAFKLPIGYSDHSLGIHIPIAAVAMGASVIEKHFTLDKELPGPDHKASLNPIELETMVRLIRETEMAVGNGIKQPVPSEIKNMEIARKSLIASKTIKKGEKFSIDNLTSKRPGSGISPMLYWQMLGKEATFDFDEGDLIR